METIRSASSISATPRLRSLPSSGNNTESGKKAEEEKEEKKEAAKKEEQQAKIDELNARIRENGEAKAAEAAARGRAARQERENAGASDITDDAVQFDIKGASVDDIL